MSSWRPLTKGIRIFPEEWPFRLPTLHKVYRTVYRLSTKFTEVNYCSFHINLSNSFWRYFLSLLISSWNFHDLWQRIFCSQKRNFSWIWQIMQNFPTVPIVKIAHFWKRLVYTWRCQKWAFFTIVIYGEIICIFVGSNWNRFRVHKKFIHTMQFSKIVCQTNIRRTVSSWNHRVFATDLQLNSLDTY